MGREFVVHYNDGTRETFNTANLIYWNAEHENSFRYVDYHIQHISKKMKEKGTLFIVDRTRKEEEHINALPINLEKVINLDSVKKIEFIRSKL